MFFDSDFQRSAQTPSLVKRGEEAVHTLLLRVSHMEQDVGGKMTQPSFSVTHSLIQAKMILEIIKPHCTG